MESRFSSLAITTNVNDDSKDDIVSSSIEMEETMDLGCQIDEFSGVVDTKEMPNDQKAIKIIHLWKLLFKSINQKTVTKLKVYFDKLYLTTSRFILKGHWYSVTNTNNISPHGEEYKSNLSHCLTELSQALKNLEHHQYSSYCRQINSLLNKSPWDPLYIKDIINSKDLITSQQARTLWENENEVLIKVRIQGLCQIKQEDKAFALAQACYFEGQRIHQDVSNKKEEEDNFSQPVYYSMDSFFQFQDIFYVFLCRQLNKTKEKTKLKNLFCIQEAMCSIKRLKNVGTERIAPTWREWKHAQRLIILTLKDFILNDELAVIDSTIVKKMFYYWIKYAFKEEEKKDLQPVKDLLSKISTIKTDYFYELANVLLEKSDKLKLDPVVRNISVEVYIRAMNQDYNNQLAKIECSETRCDDAESQKLRHKLSTRYLQLAEVFINDTNNRFFELTLTAFSLSPSEELYNRLFPSSCNTNNNNNNNNSSENNVIINSESVTTTKPDNSTTTDSTLKDRHTEIIQIESNNDNNSSSININNTLPNNSAMSILSTSTTIINSSKSEINLSSALNDDLQTVIINPRWSRLSWEKDNIALQQLCRQHLDTGGPKVKVKEDLIHLHIDYSTYEPPQLDPETEQDYGFEKGYEPEILLQKLSKERNLANRGRGGKRRGRGRVRLGMPKTQFRFNNPLNRKRSCFQHGPKIDRRFKHNRILYPLPSTSSSTLPSCYSYGDSSYYNNFTTTNNNNHHHHHNLSFGSSGNDKDFITRHKNNHYKNERKRQQPNKQRKQKKSIYDNRDTQVDGDEFNDSLRGDDEVLFNSSWNSHDKRFENIPIRKRPSDIDFKKLSINFGSRLKKCLKPIKMSTTETLSDNDHKSISINNQNMNNSNNNNNKDGQSLNGEDVKLEENVKFSFPPFTTFESFQRQLNKRNCPLFVDNPKNWNTLLHKSYGSSINWDYSFVPTSHLQSTTTTTTTPNITLSLNSASTTTNDDVNTNKTTENEALSIENIHNPTTTTCNSVINNDSTSNQNTSDKELKQEKIQYNNEFDAFDFSFEPHLTQLILNDTNNISNDYDDEEEDAEEEEEEDIRKNECYSHVFKLHCRNKFKKKDLQPIVVLDRIIPPKVVEDVASNTAFDYVITFIQQCLSVFQCACQDPSLSSTLTSSIQQCNKKNNELDTKTITSNSLKNPTCNNNNNNNNSSLDGYSRNNTPQLIPKIIQEAYDSIEKTPQKFTCETCGYYTNYVSDKSSTLSFNNKPGPKRKMNEIQCNLAVKRLSKNLYENSKIKSQALGLEFSKGHLVHAKPLEPNSTELLTMYSREALRLSTETDSMQPTFPITPIISESLKMSPETISVPTTTTTSSGCTVLKMDQVIVSQAFTRINELQNGISNISSDDTFNPPTHSNNNEPQNFGTESSENINNSTNNNSNNNNNSSVHPPVQTSSSLSTLPSSPSFFPLPLKLQNVDNVLSTNDSISNEKQQIIIDPINTPNNKNLNKSQGESEELNNIVQNTLESHPLVNTTTTTTTTCTIKNEDTDVEKLVTKTDNDDVSLQQQIIEDHYDVDALHTILKVANLIYGKPSNDFFPVNNNQIFMNTLEKSMSSSQTEYDKLKDNYCQNENTDALHNYKKEDYDMTDYFSSDTSRGKGELERKSFNTITTLSSTGRKRKLLYSRILQDEDDEEDIDDSNDSNYIPPAPKRRKILKKRNSKDGQNNNNNNSDINKSCSNEKKIKDIPTTTTTPEKRRQKRTKLVGEIEQDTSMSSIMNITTETNDKSLKFSITSIEIENDIPSVVVVAAEDDNNVKKLSTSPSGTKKQLLLPLVKEIKPDEEALQNQTLYEVGKMYLNDKTGYIEVIENLNEKDELIFEEKCEVEPYVLGDNKFLTLGPSHQFKDTYNWEDDKEPENPIIGDSDDMKNEEGLTINSVDDDDDEKSLNNNTKLELNQSAKKKECIIHLKRLSSTEIESYARKNPESPKTEMTASSSTTTTTEQQSVSNNDDDDCNNIQSNEKDSPSIIKKNNKTHMNKKKKYNSVKDEDIERDEIVIIDDDDEDDDEKSIKLQTTTTKTPTKKEVKNGNSLGIQSTSPNRRPKRQIKPNKRYRSESFTMTQDKKRKTAMLSETDSVDSQRQHTTKVEEVKKTKTNSNSIKSSASSTPLKRSKFSKNLNNSNNHNVSPITTTTTTTKNNNNNRKRSTTQKRKRGKGMPNGTRNHTTPAPSSPPVITIDDSSDENKNELPSPIVFNSSSIRRYSEPTMDGNEEHYYDDDDDDDTEEKGKVEQERQDGFEEQNDSDMCEQSNEEVNCEYTYCDEFEGEFEDVDNLSEEPLVSGFNGDDDADHYNDGGEIDDVNDNKPYESNFMLYDDDNINMNNVQNGEGQLITGDSEEEGEEEEEADNHDENNILLDNGCSSETETKDDYFIEDSDKQETCYPELVTNYDHEFVDLVGEDIDDEIEEEEKICSSVQDPLALPFNNNLDIEISNSIPIPITTPKSKILLKSGNSSLLMKDSNEDKFLMKSEYSVGLTHYNSQQQQHHSKCHYRSSEEPENLPVLQKPEEVMDSFSSDGECNSSPPTLLPEGKSHR